MSEAASSFLDELRGMAIFAVVSRSGSFAAAARELRLSRAVVSHHVRTLETKLGVPLAQRSTRSFSLTPAGEAFRIHCERLLDEAQDGIRGMELLRDEPRGEVRLTCSHHFGSKRILPALLAFRRRYPAVRLHVSMTDGNVDLVQRGVELAVRAGPLQDSSLHARKLVHLPTMLCASPAYLQRHSAPRSIAELRRHRWVIYPPSQRSVMVRSGEQTAELHVQGDVVTDSAAARLAFVARGRGDRPPRRLRCRHAARIRRARTRASACGDRAARHLPGARQTHRPERPPAARLPARHGERRRCVTDARPPITHARPSTQEPA